MRFPRTDDELPTWAHTTCVMVLVSCCAVPLLWDGAGALHTRRLAPIMGPDMGQWMFGPRTLSGTAAVAAGLSLVALAFTFWALGLAYTRWAHDRPAVRALPWLMLVLDVPLYMWALSQAPR